MSGVGAMGDKYQDMEDSSVSTHGGSEAPSTFSAKTQNISNASTHRVANRVISPASLSRNSLAASRLLRSRKGNRPSRSRATQQQWGGEKAEEKKAADLPGDTDAGDPPVASLASPANNMSLRNRAKNKHRGAYAKLMLQGRPTGFDIGMPAPKEPKEQTTGQAAADVPEDEEPMADPVKEQEELKKTSQELIGIRNQAKAEFSKGPETNSRYHASARLKKLMEVEEEENDDGKRSEASLPSVLNRSEVFHENATAAVMALLHPRRGLNTSGDRLHTSSDLSAAASEVKVTPSRKGLVISTNDTSTGSAFRSPHSHASDNVSVMSGLSSSVLDVSYEGNYPKSAITEPILSVEAERALNVVKKGMQDPTKTLADLLTAIATPQDESTMDRAFMVRRKNACGAIKVLTANASNRRTLGWTVGVLPALASVLDDTGDEGLMEAFPDGRTREEYVEARKRAVASLLHLCVPKENRIPVFHCPGLVQAVAKVIVDDTDESRQGCCAITAYLAKTQENRLLMAQVPGLLDALTGVIAPSMAHLHSLSQDNPAPKKKFHFEDDSDEEEETNNSFSTDGRNLSLESSYTDRTDRYTVDNTTMDDSGTLDSDSTPLMTSSPTSQVQKKVGAAYDGDPNRFLHGARQNVFAALTHLVKEKDNAYVFARHEKLVKTLVDISQMHDSPSHVHAIKILAHMTRHPTNAKHIVFEIKTIVPAMVLATKSKNDEARLHAIFSLQNLSQDRTCRQELANTKDLILALCPRARHTGATTEERLAAMSTLKNLTDEPANLITMSNTSECFATLMQIAHGQSDDVDEQMQFLACDALATLSHWLRKIATSGSAPPGKPSTTAALFVPTLKVVTWSQWE